MSSELFTYRITRMAHTDGGRTFPARQEFFQATMADRVIEHCNHIRGVEKVEVLTAIARSSDGTFIECRWVDCCHSVPE